MDIIIKYFPKLTKDQLAKFEALMPLYAEWNSQINVISRKDFEFFYQRHVLHSLAIAKVIRFKNGTEILDVGTGGGFPGIPLAILFPQSSFMLVDSIGKKIKVVNAVTESLMLSNVKAQQIRVEQLHESFDFIVSRAVTDLPTFLKWTRNKIRKRGFNYIRNGVLYLKGGDLTSELKSSGSRARKYPIKDFFKEDFFETKYVVHI